MHFERLMGMGPQRFSSGCSNSPHFLADVDKTFERVCSHCSPGNQMCCDIRRIALAPAQKDSGATASQRNRLVLMGLAWGLSFSLARIAAVGGVHPFGISFWESALAGGLLTIVVVGTGMRYGRSRQTLLLYVATGLLGMIIPSIGFFYAAAHISAGLLSISS